MTTKNNGADAYIEHHPENPKITRLVLPGDEQLIAQFQNDPKKKRFYDFLCFLDDRELDEELDMVTQFRLTFKEFPDITERLEFHDFASWWYGRWTLLKPKISKPDDFLFELSRTKYADPAARANWLWIMQTGSAPFVRLGESKHGGFFTGYGFRRAPEFLLPGFYDPKTNEFRIGNSENRDDIIHGSIMGIDKNTENAAPQHVTPPQQGISQPFIFAQLGNLYAYNGETDWDTIRHRPNDEILSGGTWDQTRFGVVLRLADGGAPEGVYVIYNCWEHDPNTEEGTLLRPENMNKDFVGRLHRRCGDSQRFTVAKVADGLGDLSDPSREFDFHIISTKEPILVNAFQDKQPQSNLIGDFNINEI